MIYTPVEIIRATEAVELSALVFLKITNRVGGGYNIDGMSISAHDANRALNERIETLAKRLMEGAQQDKDTIK